MKVVKSQTTTMKRFTVIVKNEEYETYLVDASTKEEAEQMVSSAMDDGSLWDGTRKNVKVYTSGRGDFWEVEPDLTEEIPVVPSSR